MKKNIKTLSTRAAMMLLTTLLFTLTAQTAWAEQTPNVRFNRCGGQDGTDYVTATYGQSMPQISVPTKEGHTFGGYYSEREGNGTQYYYADGTSAHIWDQTNEAGESIELFAKWTAYYTVDFDKCDGDGGDDNVTATYGADMFDITVPTRTGYTFCGYFTEVNGGGTKYYNADGTSAHIWDLTENTTLHAKWTEDASHVETYTVTLDRQEGSGGTGSVTVTCDAAMPSATMPTREGYAFCGYFTEVNGGGTKYYNADGSSAQEWDIAQNTTLYAYWKKLLTNGISVVIPAQNYNGTALEPEVTVKEGDAVVSNIHYTVTLPEGRKNAGNYTITITAKDGSALYAGTTTATFTINKAPLTVTANNKSINYGEAPANNGVDYDGFVENEDESVLGGTLKFAYTYTQYEPVGTYLITPYDLTAANYAITFASGTLTVAKKSLTVTAKNHRIYYGNAAANDGVTYDGFVKDETKDVLEGTLTYTYSNNNGPYGTDNDAPGDYVITPSGLTAANYAITFQPGKLTVEAITVKVNVVDIANGEDLEGAHVQVLNTEENFVAEWNSGTESHEVGGLKAGKTYTLHETVAPDGYVLPTDYTFTIATDGTVTTTGTTTTDTSGNIVLLVENSKTHVEVSVVGTHNEGKLSGATVQVLDPESNIVREWTSTTESRVIEGLETGVEYTIRETVAPDGYVLPTDYTFTIAANGTITSNEQTVTVLLVENSRTHVEISVVDTHDGAKLAGGHVQVKKSNGDLFDEWDPTTANYAIEGLKTGEEYTIHETIAPQNYALSSDYTFTIAANGTITYTGTKSNDGVLLVQNDMIINLSVAINWEDFTDNYDVRPASVTVTLSANNESVKTVTLDATHNWGATETGLLKYDNDNKEINYSWTIADEIGCYEQHAPQVDGTATTFEVQLMTSGECGLPGQPAVEWNYDTDEKTITIEGSGQIPDYAFYGAQPWRAFRSELVSIVIGNGITIIGQEAFHGCSSLTSLDIPANVTSIGSNAFNGCTSLTTVTVNRYDDTENAANPITTLYTDVFNHCENLTTIIVPITALQSYYNATSWASYKEQLVASGYCGKDNTETTDIDESHNVIWTLTRLATDFQVATAWENVEPYNPTAWTTVPAYKLTISGTGAMEDYDDTETPWAAADFYFSSGETYNSYTDKSVISELEIGAGVSVLGANAFNGLQNLTSLTIADESALTTIAPSDFRVNLTTVSLPTTVTTIDLKNDPRILDDALKNAAWHAYHEKFSTVGGYCGTTANSANGQNLSWTLAWNGGEADDKGSYPLILTITGEGAMADYTAGNAPWGTYPDVLSLSEGLTYIGTYAFYQCNFATVNIPASVTYINGWAFERATKAVTFAEDSQLTTLYGFTFQNCDLTSVTIPASVTTIGGAFKGCSKLEHVTFAEGNKPLVMGETFALCTSLETIDIPARVTSFKKVVFAGCSSLKTVTMLGDIPPTLGRTPNTTDSPFTNCSSLSVILVPNETAYADYKSAATWNGTANGDEDNKTNYAHLLAPAAITLKGNTSGWTTYCHNYIVSYSVEDGAAYTVSGINGSNVQTAAAQYVAPYTPTLVYKENGGNITLTAVPTTATQVVPNNYDGTTGLVTQTGNGFTFVGATTADVADYITAGQSYALYDGEFLKIDDSTLSLPAHRCMLTLNASNSARRLSIGDGETTNITTTDFTDYTDKAGAWYTLDGRKLNGKPTTKGLYIYNERKVVVK